MSIFKRMSTIFKAKANSALDKAEDPRETLDYSYQKQLELLQKVRRGVADVATSRKRVELQASLATLLTDLPGLALAGEPTRHPTFTHRGFATLPVTLHEAELNRS